MDSTNPNPRFRLIRETATLQIKLLADGIRDAVLIPISLLASLIGLLRGGEDCDREYRRVIKLGRRSERWINLFGHHRPLSKVHPAKSLDEVLEQAEAVVIGQIRKSRTAGEDAKTGTETKSEKEEEQEPKSS